MRPLPLAHVVGQRRAMGLPDERRGGCPKAPTPSFIMPSDDRPNYWTVTTPFMFIARCGTQTTSYLPAGILANDTV